MVAAEPETLDALRAAAAAEVEQEMADMAGEKRKTIYDAILELSAAFAREGLAPPKAIELADSDEGHRMLMVARRDMPPNVFLTEAELRNPHDNECEICGVKIRWPRGYWMRQDGALAKPGEE